MSVGLCLKVKRSNQSLRWDEPGLVNWLTRKGGRGLRHSPRSITSIGEERCFVHKDMALSTDWVTAVASVALVFVTAGLVYYTYVLGKFARELNALENRRDGRERFERDKAQILSPLHSMMRQTLKNSDDWLKDNWLNEDSLFFVLKPHYDSNRNTYLRKDVGQLKTLRDTAKESHSKLEKSIHANTENALENGRAVDKTGQVTKFLTEGFKKTVAEELFMPLLLDSDQEFDKKMKAFEKDYNVEAYKVTFQRFAKTAFSEARDGIRQARSEFGKCRDDFFGMVKRIDEKLEIVLLTEGGELQFPPSQ